MNDMRERLEKFAEIQAHLTTISMLTKKLSTMLMDMMDDTLHLPPGTKDTIIKAMKETLKESGL